MALYLNGKRALNSLVVDGAGSLKLISAQSRNTASTGNLSYTFTESGTFQFYAFLNSSSTVSSSYITVSLNGVTITPQYYMDGDHLFAYDEITVSANDIITISNTIAESNRGMQLFVFRDANISNFREIGYVSNNNTSISYTSSDFPLLEALGQYNSNANTLTYRVLTDGNVSQPVPSGATSYYYAKCWAIKL